MTFINWVNETENRTNWFSQSFVPIVSYAKTLIFNGISFVVVTKAKANQLTSG